MNTIEPPFFCAWLIGRVARWDGGSLQGDLDEEFRTVVVPRDGLERARAWYRKQVLASLYALGIYAARDLAGPAMGALAGLLAWDVAAHTALTAVLATPTPLGEISGLTFTLVFVLGGALVAGLAGALLRPSRVFGVAVVAGLIGIVLLFQGVDEPLGLGYRVSWAMASIVGAFSGAFLGKRWASPVMVR